MNNNTTEETNKLKDDIMLAIQTGNVDGMLDIMKKIPTPYFSYDCREDKKLYPEAFNDLKEFLVNNSNGNLTELSNSDLNIAIFTNPRILYDYFDNKNLMIGVYFKENKWISVVKNTELNLSFNNRHEAESQSFSNAFKLLNEEIKNKKSNG